MSPRLNIITFMSPRVGGSSSHSKYCHVHVSQTRQKSILFLISCNSLTQRLASITSLFSAVSVDSHSLGPCTSQNRCREKYTSLLYALASMMGYVSVSLATKPILLRLIGQHNFKAISSKHLNAKT